MLEKYTFGSDNETNKFFRQNPDIYLVKMIVTNGKQHVIVHRQINDHLRTNCQTINGSAFHGGS